MLLATMHVVMHFSLSLILFTSSSYSAFYVASELCGGQVHAQPFNCFCMRRKKSNSEPNQSMFVNKTTMFNGIQFRCMKPTFLYQIYEIKLKISRWLFSGPRPGKIRAEKKQIPYSR